MSERIYAHMVKNSPQPQYSDGFEYSGRMDAQSIEVSIEEPADDLVNVSLNITGLRGQNSDVYQLRVSLPQEMAESLAMAITSVLNIFDYSNPSKIPSIRINC